MELSGFVKFEKRAQKSPNRWIEAVFVMLPGLAKIILAPVNGEDAKAKVEAFKSPTLYKALTENSSESYQQKKVFPHALSLQSAKFGEL